MRTRLRTSYPSSLRLGLSILIAGLLLAMTVPERAAGVDYPGETFGMGTSSCGEFVEAKDSNNQRQLDLYVQWVQGFLTAYNFHGLFDKTWRRVPQIQNMPDAPTVLLFLDSHCRKHATDKIVQGTLALVKELGVPISTVR